MISESEIALLVERCKSIPPAQGNYLETDFIRNLFLTVLDFQMHGRAVEKAIQHYEDHKRNQVRTIDQLEAILVSRPDDKVGNTEVAMELWGNKHWTRVRLLRGLVDYFKKRNVTDQDLLRQWATVSDYDRDFKGRIPGMGMAIYNWLVMRQGIESVKPDVHLHRFVEATVGRPVSDVELVSTLRQVARLLSLKAYELDWRIWEYQRGEGWTVPTSSSGVSG